VSNPDFARKKTILMILLPQGVILLVSTLWILLFPKDHVSKFFHLSFSILFEGLLTGAGLALAGYGFYFFAKKTKKFYEAVELFEQVLSPTFKNLKLVDLLLLSVMSGFNEEVFFRGLLFPKVGIIISSIAFGTLHFPGKKYWIYAVWATCSAALFAYLFHLTNSLWLPIIAHVTNNLIGMVLLTRMAKGGKI